jgi:SAM-dependent methyltransferase
MGTDVSLDARKAEVRRFWEAASCGEVYAEGGTAEEKLRQNGEARYRLEPYIREFARFWEGSGQDVLEIGVGMGADHLEWARSSPHHLAGIDLTPRAVSWTAQQLDAFGLKSDLREGDAENLPFADRSFSIVYSWGVLHHSPDTPRAFLEAYRVLRPGGTLRVLIWSLPELKDTPCRKRGDWWPRSALAISAALLASPTCSSAKWGNSMQVPGLPSLGEPGRGRSSAACRCSGCCC